MTIERELAEKIFSENTYTEVDLISADEVEKIINSYKVAELALSKVKGRTYPYTGMNDVDGDEKKTYHGNVFVKTICDTLYGTTYNRSGTDRIWVVLYYIKSAAEKDSRFDTVYRPDKYAAAAIDKVTSTHTTLFLYGSFVIIAGAVLYSVSRKRRYHDRRRKR